MSKKVRERPFLFGGARVKCFERTVFLAFVFKHVFESVVCPHVSITCRDLVRERWICPKACNDFRARTFIKPSARCHCVRIIADCAHQLPVSVIHRAEGTSDSAWIMAVRFGRVSIKVSVLHLLTYFIGKCGRTPRIRLATLISLHKSIFLVIRLLKVWRAYRWWLPAYALFRNEIRLSIF